MTTDLDGSGLRDIAPWLMVVCETCVDEKPHEPRDLRWSATMPGYPAVPIPVCQACWNDAREDGHPLPCRWEDLDPIVRPLRAEERMAADILAELVRAREKFPGYNSTLAALMEEAGELAKALMEESPAAVYKEAIQTAVMAMRVALDGDGPLEHFRQMRGLAPINPDHAPRRVAHAYDLREMRE